MTTPDHVAETVRHLEEALRHLDAASLEGSLGEVCCYAAAITVGDVRHLIRRLAGLQARAGER